MRRLLEGYTNLHKEYNFVQLTADTLEEIINTANMAELKKQFEDLIFSIGVKVDHGDAALARYLEFFFESMIKLKIIMAGTYQVDNTLEI